MNSAVQLLDGVYSHYVLYNHPAPVVAFNLEHFHYCSKLVVNQKNDNFYETKYVECGKVKEEDIVQMGATRLIT